MKAFGFVWGIGGILLLLTSAVYRLAPVALALECLPLSLLHWAALVFSMLYMAYAEGYKGFHQGFAPRVVIRADYLRQNPRVLHVLLAPIFCMGYIYATRRRKLLSYGLSLMIVSFVLVARMLPQPWRGIVDAGVVIGLAIGIGSIMYFLIVIIFKPERLVASAEVPTDS
ncbi:MAG: hypothetical protein EXR84_02615 [Gammaproteobacteria bacterium]|nr:hypothetical protein [Gammaproteobacteria bacterium]